MIRLGRKTMILNLDVKTRKLIPDSGAKLISNISTTIIIDFAFNMVDMSIEIRFKFVF